MPQAFHLRTVLAAALLTAMVGFTGHAFAQDTPGNRLAAATNYLDAIGGMASLLEPTVSAMAENLPPENRPLFRTFMKTAIDTRKLEIATVAAMARHFTVQELNSMAAFYGSETGKSILKKFPQYMAETMPTIQQMVVAGYVQFIAELAEAKR